MYGIILAPVYSLCILNLYFISILQRKMQILAISKLVFQILIRSTYSMWSL